MRPSKIQLKVIGEIRNILSMWEDTNDIFSPTHYNDMREILNANLEEHFTDNYIDRLYEALDSLFYQVQRANVEQLNEIEL